ncbi:MAG: class I SAM-dependent RNA methyltransferase [Deltaproteobacteria bacterium]|nr:class I SAM-dependent RNA methyltransferase [Deltaproteobacteria bacterium]
MGRAAETLELRIDELAAGGDGVGRADDGRVVFVPFTAPGDRVRVRVERAHARFLNAKVEALLEPSPHRSDPVCAVFGSCGGCAWQHVDYKAQLDAKAKIVCDAFQRIAGTAAPAKLPITPSPAEYGYRSRARVFVHAGRVGFRRPRSHALCETERCPILAPPLQHALVGLARSEAVHDGEWELVAGDDSSRAVEVGRDDGLRVGWRLAEDRFEVSAGVFAQSNAGLFGPLEMAVVGAAGEGALVYDFFAGAGFFTLGLARRFERVLALESNRAAARDLEHNLAAAGLSNVRVSAERLEHALHDGSLDGERPDAIVLDPPRTGLPPGSSDALAQLEPERIVYLACDPATQARDVGYLIGSGYRLARLEAFDLFPQTPHVESLAVLELAGC